MIAHAPVAALQASPAALRLAKTTASSPHGLVNLIRFVGALEKQAAAEDLGGEEALGEGSVDDLKQFRMGQDIAYANALLSALREENESSSTSQQTLDELQRTLADVERQYRSSIATHSSTAPSLRKSNGTLPSVVPADRDNNSRDTAAPLDRSPQEQMPATTLRHRPHVQSTEQYLRKRVQEDQQGGEIGLLPLRPRAALDKPKTDDREELLRGNAGVGMGSAQLHEELGGQLADMSHRLKLNAMHFANSLEEEKALLDDSTDVLEKNLSNTRSSKSDLAKVSRKGRGTTCMTIGIIILVMVIFIWTYMLIRFT